MTPNIASPIFNTLLTMFFLVIAVGCATGAFAAIQLGRAQKRYEADEAQLAAAAPVYDMTTPDPAPVEDDLSWEPAAGTDAYLTHDEDAPVAE